MKHVFRFAKGTFWYLVVTLLGILYYDYAPLSGVPLWIGLVVFVALEWVAISKLRERLRF
jgi:hypothetical protein